METRNSWCVAGCVLAAFWHRRLNLTMPTWFRRKGLKNAVTVSPFENTPFRRRPPAERLLLVLLAACVLGACAHQHMASTDPRSNTCDERGITIQWNRCDDVVVCVARTPCGQTRALRRPASATARALGDVSVPSHEAGLLSP